MARNRQHPCDASPERGRVYGRKHGRPLRPGRRDLIESLLPQLSFTLPDRSLLDPATLFPNPPDEIWLEVGFGGGEHLAAQAGSHPQTGFIGCESFINGMASLLAKIKKENLDNIRVFSDDARVFMDSLVESSLDRVFILFPDPWPKKRHHKRRLVQASFIQNVSRVLKADGVLHITTDWDDYALHIKEVLKNNKQFSLSTEDESLPLLYRPPTKFERRGRKLGHNVTELYFRLK